MRPWLTILTLASFLPQQFACCVADCGSCVESVQPVATGDSHPAGYHSHAVCLAGREHLSHDHAHEPCPEESPADTDHHLCVSTHVFFVVRASDDLPVPSSLTMLRLDQFQTDGNSRNSLHHHHPLHQVLIDPAPDTPQQRRARLSVCIV